MGMWSPAPALSSSAGLPFFPFAEPAGATVRRVRDVRDVRGATDEPGDEGRARARAAMARYGAGDDAAFGDVYDDLSPRLYRYLLRLTRDQARAEDLLQQTFLQLHDARGRFLPGADVLPWSYAIARRLFIDGTRRQKRDHLHDEYDEGRSAEQNAAPSGQALAEAREIAEALRAKLEELPPLQREAFRLIREEGLSVADAAAILGVTPAAVKLRTHRAYEGLREALAPFDLLDDVDKVGKGGR